MIYYSHRGNLNGANSQEENNPSYIQNAIESGYHVEIDLNSSTTELFLGHDYPQYKINSKWIDERAEKLLIHIKSYEMLKFVVKNYPHWHYFCHSSDRFTTTSKGIIWLHEISYPLPGENAIIPLISKDLVDSWDNRNVYGICSDYIEYSKQKNNQLDQHITEIDYLKHIGVIE